MADQDKPPLRHHAVVHPAVLEARQALGRYEHRSWGRVNLANDFLASHLGVIFGSVWVIWVFFVWPLVVGFFPVVFQDKTFYYGSGWVQLFALPLFVWVGNKLQRSNDAQSEAQHQALTHIATVSDENQEILQLLHQMMGVLEGLVEENTDLTRQVHASVAAPGEAPASTGE